MIRRLRAIGALALTAFAVVAANAGAAEIVDEIPVNPNAYGGYTFDPDGSIWAIGQTSGIVYNLSSENGGIQDSFQTFSGGFWTTLAYYNGRVYAGDSPFIYSWQTGTDDTTRPGEVFSDSDMQSRIGSNQMILRAYGNGTGTLALGQNNKAATLNLSDVSETSPFYGNTWFGAGINDPNQQATAFQSCSLSGSGVVIGGGEPTSTYCGKGLGKGGSSPGQFDYAIDTAAGQGAVWVLESFGNEVSVVDVSNEGCPCSSFKFGSGPGNAAGQLSSPFSIVYVPSNGHLFISNQGTSNRIDEWTGGGDYIRSFGFGVRTGANQFEECGVGIGQCQAAVPYQTEPRSYFTQLNYQDGLLYAGTPVDQSIQVIDVGGGAGDPTIKLTAKPDVVKKGKKTTLTAKLNSCEDDYKALFQVKDGNDWNNVGAVKTNDSCKAEKKVKISKKSVFQAISIDENEVSLATSRKVVVKVKKKKKK